MLTALNSATALMMLGVMAKNCNIKCPAGLVFRGFDGGPRALAQYFMNVAQEIREILAFLASHRLRRLEVGRLSSLN